MIRTPGASALTYSLAGWSVAGKPYTVALTQNQVPVPGTQHDVSGPQIEDQPPAGKKREIQTIQCHERCRSFDLFYQMNVGKYKRAGSVNPATGGPCPFRADGRLRRVGPLFGYFRT